MKESKDSACCSKNIAKQQLPCDKLRKSLECISDSRFASCSSSGIKPCNICLQHTLSLCRLRKTKLKDSN